MNDRHDIHDQLWDLVYGLLEPDEKAALHAQIKSDPAVARMYADTILEAELLKKAARIETPLIELPGQQEKVALGKPIRRVKQDGASSLSRGLNWLAGMGTAALALFIALMLWRPETSQVPALATARVLEVFGAPVWQPGISNRLKIVARAASGAPQSVDLRVEVRDAQGVTNYFRDIRTSDAGIVQFEVPGEAVKAGSRVQVMFADGLNAAGREVEGAAVNAALPAQSDAARATVTVDRDWYAPGDAVRFRANVLERYSLQAADNAALRYEVDGPDGKPVAEATGAVVTQNGVAAAAIRLPAEVAEGRYSLRVRGDNVSIAGDQADFIVQQNFPLRKLDALSSSSGPAKPGSPFPARPPASSPAPAPEKAGADAAPEAKRIAGLGGYGGGKENPLARNSLAPLRQRSAQDKSGTEKEVVKGGATAASNSPKEVPPVAAEQDVASARGRSAADEASPPEGALMRSGDSQSNDIAFRYFGSSEERNADRRLKLALPIDEAGKQLRVVVTDALGEVVQSSDAVAKQVDNLADVAASQARKVRTPNRYDSALGLETAEYKAKSGKPEASPEPQAQNERLAEVELRIAPELQGPVRAYAFDFSEKPARVVAQDDLYLAPLRELVVSFYDFDANYIPGQEVALNLQITDEQNRPAANAVVGLRVVDEIALQAAPEAETLASRWNLALSARSDIEGMFGQPSTGVKSPNAGLAQSHLSLQDGVAGPSRSKARDTSSGTSAASGVHFDSQPANDAVALAAQGDRMLGSNRHAVESALERASSVRATQRAIDYRFAGQVLLGSGLFLACLGAIVYGLRLAPNSRVWIPTLAMCAASLIVGVLWIERSSTRQTEVAMGTPASKMDGEAAQGAKTRPTATVPEYQLPLGDEDVGSGSRGGNKFADSEMPKLDKSLEERLDGPKDRFAMGNAPADGSHSSSDRLKNAKERLLRRGELDKAAKERGVGLDSKPQAPKPENGTTDAPWAEAAASASSRPAAKLLEEQLKQKSELEDRVADKRAPHPEQPMGNAARGVRNQTSPAEKPTVKAANVPASGSPAAGAAGPLSEAASGPAPAKPQSATTESRSAKPAEKSPEPSVTAPRGASPTQAAMPESKVEDATKIALGKKSALGAAEFSKAKRNFSATDSAALAAEGAKTSGDQSRGQETVDPYVPLWAPALMTDHDGRATVRFRLPLRPATYRVLVDAHGNGRIGSAMSTIIVTTKDDPQGSTEHKQEATPAPGEEPQSKGAASPAPKRDDDGDLPPQ